MFDEKFKKIISAFLTILSLYVIVLAYNGFQESKYIGKDASLSNTINVNATGEVFAAPDVANFSVSVVKEAKTALEAQNQNAEAINKIVKFLKDSGIEDKDIKLLIDEGTVIPHVKEALIQFLGYIVQFEKDELAKLAQSSVAQAELDIQEVKPQE